MGHSGQQAKALILLPDRKYRPIYSKGRVKLGLEIIPAQKVSTGFVVGEKKKAEKKKKQELVF
jgi:hypothetical protein